jgi:DNA recombination protein RmuC
MIEILLVAILAVTAVGALLALLAFLACRRSRVEMPLSRLDAGALLRAESDLIRSAMEANSRELRQELLQGLNRNQQATFETMVKLSDSLLTRVDEFGVRLEKANQNTEARINSIGVKLNTDIDEMGKSAGANREALRGVIEQKLDASAVAHTEAACALREALDASFHRMRQGVSDTLIQVGSQQKERLDETKRTLEVLSETHKQAGEQLRVTVEGRLDLLRSENSAELEKVRATVDEKLQTTLEKRLDESFGRVVEQLNKAYEVFGEMRNISAQVGTLNNVLTNPKLRGTFGEVQLAMLLQDFLSPGQYVKDAQVKDGSSERVEYAIRLPMADGAEMLLPVDAKFPREDHEHMLEALEIGDVLLVEKFRKQLENRIKACAKDICRKYINPPRTTERAILFLPTESLFAEVLRLPGLFDFVQRECNVMLAGPTTFAAILHAFQVNHRSMAIAQRSSEVWNILSAVRTEFTRYNKVVAKVSNQLKTATGSVEELDRRTRAMDRALKRVETLPDEDASAKLLGLDGVAESDMEDGGDPLPLTVPLAAAE